MEINTEELYTILDGMHKIGIPVMVFGDPGLGKTQIIKSLGQEKEVATVCKSANRLTEVELSGIPYIVDVQKDSENGVESHTKDVKYSIPEYVKTLNKEDNGILFFDELPTAPTSIQSMLLTIIQDKEFNDFKLPKATFCIAAGNYNNVNGQQQLNAALFNRMCILNLKYDLDCYLRGSATNWQIKINAIVERDEKVILKNRLKYINLRESFLKTHRTMGYTMSEDGVVDERDLSFASPRSWDNLLEVMVRLDKNPANIIRPIINGLIGEDAGNLFWDFLQNEKPFECDLTSFVGKEDTFEIPDIKRHDQVTFIVQNLIYLSTIEGSKYLKLGERIINLLHNKDNKYGKYASYDGIIMTYITPFMRNCLKDKPQSEKSAIVKDLFKEIDDWNTLQSYSVMNFD